MANISYTTKLRERDSSPAMGTTVKLSKSGEVSPSGNQSDSRYHSFIEPYRPNIQGRSIIIQRGGPMGGSRSKSSHSMEKSVGYSLLGSSSSAFASLNSSGVVAEKQSRVQEKKDMQDLNERLANYIEKVRFLEAQNRKLADENEKLKARWGKETTQVKAMYQSELDEARRLLDEANKDKSKLEIRTASLEETFEEYRQMFEEVVQEATSYRDKFEKQIQQIADQDGELSLLRKRMASTDADKEKDRANIKKLQDGLNSARADLDSETLQHIDSENRRQSLEEELEFMKSVHEQELKELQTLAYRDSTTENREYWKNEMGQALREIQETYDEKLEMLRSETEAYYNLKVQEMKTGSTRNTLESTHSKDENKRLKSQLGPLKDKVSEQEIKIAHLMQALDSIKRDRDEKEHELEGENSELKSEIARLRAEMEALLYELQKIIDTKLGLELEIAAYRKLLEGEESRIGLKQVIDSITSVDRSAGGSGGGFGSGVAGVGFGGGSSGSGMGGGMAGSGSGGGFGFGGSEIGNGMGSSDADISKERSSLNFSKPSNKFTGGNDPTNEPVSKTAVQKSAKGPIVICDSSMDGKFITIENTGKREEYLGGWSVKRNVDGLEKVFVFPLNFSFKAGNKFKIWARGSQPNPLPSGDLIFEEESWGRGLNVVTKLTNTLGEDRANYVAKTHYV